MEAGDIAHLIAKATTEVMILNYIVIKNMSLYCMNKQTTEEISFLDSLEDSIFYSITRYFLLEINTVLPPSGNGN